MANTQDVIDGWIDRAIARRDGHEDADFSLDDMAELARTIRQQARSMNIAIVCSIVDDRGQQRLLFSMDNVLLVSHALAPKKAWSAAALKMATHDIAREVQPGAGLYGLQHQQEMCCIGGGFPLWIGNRFVGAVGVSGGTAEQDMAVVRNGVAAFSQRFYSLLTSPSGA